MYGGRISLAVGFVATAVALVIGVTWGAVAGYVGGRVDAVMMRLVDILYALPFMIFHCPADGGVRAQSCYCCSWPSARWSG